MLGVVLLAHGLLRPFRELAASVTGQQQVLLYRLVHSTIDEVVAVATAIEKTESRLKISMAQIERDHADMSALFEHMADGVLVLDGQDRVELANPGARRLRHQDSMEGRPLPSAVHSPDVVRAARDGSVVTHPVQLRVRTVIGPGCRWSLRNCRWSSVRSCRFSM